MLAAELLTAPCFSLSFLSMVSISPSPQALSNCAFSKGPSLHFISISNYTSLQTSSNFCEAWDKTIDGSLWPTLLHFWLWLHSTSWRPFIPESRPWSTYPHPLHPSPKTCGQVSGSERGTLVTSSMEDRPRKRLVSALKRGLVPFGQWIPEPKREHIGCGWACPLGHVDMGGAGGKPDWDPL